MLDLNCRALLLPRDLRSQIIRQRHLTLVETQMFHCEMCRPIIVGDAIKDSRVQTNTGKHCLL
jgi:hypothetical protein